MTSAAPNPHPNPSDPALSDPELNQTAQSANQSPSGETLDQAATHDNTSTDRPVSRSAGSRFGFVALGIMFILLGLGALVFPLLATLSLNLVAGAALIAAGLFTLIHAVRSRGWRGFGWQALLGLLYTAAGAIFLFNPLAGMFTLTVLVGALFAADGIARILLALRIRPERSWWLFLGSGLLSLIVGGLVLLGLPSGLSLAFLGIMLGINLIFAGVSYIACSGENADCEPGGAFGRAVPSRSNETAQSDTVNA